MPRAPRQNRGCDAFDRRTECCRIVKLKERGASEIKGVQRQGEMAPASLARQKAPAMQIDPLRELSP